MRKILFWLHLAVGVTAGAVILIMSVTGVLLTYQRQMTAWSVSDMRVESAGTSRASLDALLATARSAAPDVQPTSIVFRAEPGAPTSMSLGRGRTLYLNPATAADLGEGSTGMRDFFRVVTDLHRWLAMTDADRVTARQVTGAANLAFLFLVLSGLFLWVPRRWTWTQVRAVLFFRRGLGGKARDFNWHHVFGLWFAVPLALVVASGVVISYPWASALVYKAVGETPPAPAGQAAPTPAPREGTRAASREGAPTLEATAAAPVSVADLEPLVARALTHTTDWRTVTLTLPQPDAKRVSFNIDAGDGGQPQLRRTLAFDRASGEIVQDETFAQQTAGRRLRSILRFAHTGEVLGIPGQTIAGLASLAGAILVWTGIALSTRRLAARVRRAR